MLPSVPLFSLSPGDLSQRNGSIFQLLSHFSSISTLWVSLLSVNSVLSTTSALSGGLTGTSRSAGPNLGSQSLLHFPVNKVQFLAPLPTTHSCQELKKFPRVDLHFSWPFLPPVRLLSIEATARGVIGFPTHNWLSPNDYREILLKSTCMCHSLACNHSISSPRKSPHFLPCLLGSTLEVLFPKAPLVPNRLFSFFFQTYHPLQRLQVSLSFTSWECSYSYMESLPLQYEY